MELGVVQKVDIDQEMQQSYLDYAMSVIVSRALPDARDGLKPVQRRILYAMYDMGLTPSSSFKKSARIVGEVLGKYHPHGDMAVYEAMARMAQDFSFRYPLVEGQGNFGSVDGDPPAAMRYTEARLAPYAIEIIAQLERDTVDFTANFDQTMLEPAVLPAAMPNLLVNGASGIAVGMATNIPPHNLGEVISALSYMLKQWERLDDVGVPDLMKFIQGPDFPTGGIILQSAEVNELLAAYGSGKGKITVRGKVHSEEMGRGRSRLIITELPYQVNKSSLIERIAELVREGNIEGIVDLRDESDRQGMRIVIELGKTNDSENVLRALYKHTPLETTFGINLLALVDGEPRLLNLKQALRVYLEHRIEVVRRRSEFDLAKARQRAHILEGLRIALKNLDEIIALIRKSPNVDTARERLIKQYQMSDTQAQSVLDLPLRRLAALERKKIEEEYKQLMTTIKDLELLLKSPQKIRQVVENELLLLRETYADRRRTQIVSLKAGESAKSLLTLTDLTPPSNVWVVVTREGKIFRTNSDTPPKLSGQSAPRWLIRCNTHHTIYLVTDQGQAAALAAHALPINEGDGEGSPISKVSPLDDKDNLIAVFSVPPQAEIIGEKYILTASASGLVKKSPLSDLPGPTTQKFILVKVSPSDYIIGVEISDGSAEIGLISTNGMIIRFSEQEVRPMGLVAAGVMGIKLAESDSVIDMFLWKPETELILASSIGRVWRMSSSEFSPQGRYGQGVAAVKQVKGEKLVGACTGEKTEIFVCHFTKSVSKQARVGSIPISKKLGNGTKFAELRSGDVLIEISVVIDGLKLWESKPKPTTRKPRKPASPGKEPLQGTLL